MAVNDFMEAIFQEGTTFLSKWLPTGCGGGLIIFIIIKS